MAEPMRINARKTTYTSPHHTKPDEMRSGTEAQWAQEYDNMQTGGLLAEWIYEPHRFASENIFYLPDFLLRYPSAHQRANQWVEVKGTIADDDLIPFMEAMEVIWDKYPNDSLQLIQGSPRDDYHFWITYPVPDRGNGRVWADSRTLGDIARINERGGGLYAPPPYRVLLNNDWATRIVWLS